MSTRFRKVLLLNPPYLGRGGLRPPLNLGALSEILLAGSIDHDILDMTRGLGKQALKKKIRAYKPDLIAVSMMTYTYLRTFALIRSIKKLFPHIVVIAGGPHISTVKQEALIQCPELDFGWVYECETGLADFCNGKDLENISGLIYRKDRTIAYPREGIYEAHLDDFSFPKYEKFDLTCYQKEIDLVTSRGCPYSCVFCPAKNSSGKIMRYRSPENILHEITYWYGKGYHHFAIADDNFTLNRERCLAILDAVEKAGFRDITFRAATGVRADLLDREILEKMKRTGFRQLSIGVESGSNRVLKLMKKGETVETIERSIQMACDMGFDVILFFVIGSLGETYEDFLDSVKLAEKFPVFNVLFSNMTPYPKTEMYEWVKQHGTFVIDSSVYLNRIHRSYDLYKPLFYTPEFSDEERRHALRLRLKVSRKILMKFLSRKLKKFGILGKAMAYIGSNYFIYDKIINTKIIRHMAQKILLKY